MSDNQFQLIMNKLNEMQDETNKRFCNMEESTNERFGNMNERFSKMDKRFDKLEKDLKETKDELQKEIQETNNRLEQGLQETNDKLEKGLKKTKDELQKEIKNTKNEIKHVNIAAQGMIRIVQDDMGEVKHRLGKIEEKQNLHEHQMTAMMNNMTKGFKENKEQISELQKEYNQLLNI